jgi:hypothetical protein
LANQAAVKGANTHFGTYSVNETDSVVTFVLAHAFFPNWEGRQLPCRFTLSGSEFSFINPSPPAARR